MSEAAPNRRWLLTLFSVILAYGLFQVLIALVLTPSVRVEFQLDAVLTSEEWHDVATRERTRDLLLRAAGNEYLLWLASGLVVSVAGATGLWLARSKPATH